MVFFLLFTSIIYAKTYIDNFHDKDADGWIVSLPWSSAPPENQNWRVEYDIDTKSYIVKEDFGSDGYKFLNTDYQATDQTVEADILWHDNGQAGLAVWATNDDNWVTVIYPVGGVGGFRIAEKWCTEP